MWKDNEWYASRVEELPIGFVQQFIGNDLRKTPQQMMRLQNDIAINGFEHPITLVVGRNDKRVYIGEGNHRLAIAENLGLSTIPVMVGLRRVASNPVSGYDAVVYPYLNTAIEDTDFITYRPSDVFTRIEVVAIRVNRKYVRYIK